MGWLNSGLSKGGGQGTASCRSLSGLLQSPHFLCSYERKRERERERENVTYYTILYTDCSNIAYNDHLTIFPEYSMENKSLEVRLSCVTVILQITSHLKQSAKEIEFLIFFSLFLFYIYQETLTLI